MDATIAHWSPESVRHCLKYLLFQLARVSDRPAAELDELLQEVITELRDETEAALSTPPKLRLVVPSES